MKSLTFLVFLLFLSILSNAQKVANFTLRGTVAGNVRKIILTCPDIPGQRRSYTIHVKNGYFVFKGYISAPVYAGIMNDYKVDPNNKADVSNYIYLFLSPGSMTISLKRDHFDEAVITGSPTQNEWVDLKNSEAPINKIKDSLYNIMFGIERAGNTPKNHKAHQAIVAKIDICDRQIDQMDYHYIITHPQSCVSSYLLSNFAWGGDMPLDSVERPYNAFSEAVKKSASGIAIEKIIIRRKAGSVGTIVRMPSGINLNVSRFAPQTFRIENYALLYFWADRAQDNNRLKEFYNQYHTKGLNTLAISMTPFKKMWRDTVKKDGMGIWYNIFCDPVANLDTFYNIREMTPSLLLLIDKNHKVIGRYRGSSTLYKRDYMEGDLNDLGKKLAELYK